MIILRTKILYSLAACSLWSVLNAESQADKTISLELNGERVEGNPISWTNSEMCLLTRTGALKFFNPHHAKNVRTLSGQFCSYSANEMRASLYREFGKKFDVTDTGHYLVVHPKGQRDVWASRFEELYRNFMHYFRTRRIHPSEPQFPLVAVVFHRRDDFLRYAVSDGLNAKSYLGYYSPSTNRILLYDTTVGRQEADWTTNAATIIHEATHQTANNTQIHSRFGSTPRWVAEGLATMFEAHGVWNPRRYRQRSDRINRGRLRSFRRHLKTHTSARLVQLVANDRMFYSQQNIAYTEAWALTFFLAELEPRKYGSFLQKTASRQPFAGYSSAQRQKDFTDVFGKDLAMLDARLQRFIREQK